MFFIGGRDGFIGVIKKRLLMLFFIIFGKIYLNKVYGNVKLMMKLCILMLFRS